jgi:ribonuclease E
VEATPRPEVEDAPAFQAAPIAPTAEAPVAEAPVSEPTAAPAAPAPGAGEEDVWVELHAEDEKPARPRRSRTRGRTKAGSATDPAALVPLADQALEAARAPANEPINGPASSPLPAPVAILAEADKKAAPNPSARDFPRSGPAEPDPAEIQAPPTAPRRGWWRRGA